MKEKSQKKNKQNNSKSKPKPQNGKGSTPRNLSEQFKKNYDQINWRKSEK